MPDYDAYDFFERHPSERFPEWTLGLGVWREWGNVLPERLRTILDELIRNRRAASWGLPPLKCPRLFVSHQRADETRARDIADLARALGYDVWLDVLEPALKFPKRAPDLEEESRAVAAIIEMALLNCTHVLAVLTTEAERSRWVPYEYGRVKDSSPYSLNAACWMDNQLATGGLPEYFLLGAVTRSDGEITSWLKNELASWRLIHSECRTKQTGTDSNVDATSTADERPDEVRKRSDDELSVFYKGLDHDITTRTIRLKKRNPST